jgi:hypothetical protein
VTGPAGDLGILLGAETRFSERLERAKREAAVRIEAVRVEAEQLARAASEMAESEREAVRSRVETETSARLEAIRSTQAIEMGRYSRIEPERREALVRFLVERLIDDLAADGTSEAK